MLRTAIIVIVAVTLVVFWQSAYKVDQTEMVLVTQFGDIRSTETNPGLHFKTPFIQQVTRLDKRVLRVDVQPASFPDIDSQFLEIDAYIRYRIRPADGDIRGFRESLINERAARDPISQIVVASLRDEVGSRQREQIIGGLITVNELSLIHI